MPAFAIPANLAFDNYAELVSALNDWLDRADLDGNAQQMIALAEARMRRLLAPLFAQANTTVTTSVGVGELPSDFGTLDRVIYDNRVVPQYGATTAPALLTGSEPWGFTLEANSIRLWPSGDYDVTLLYQPTLTSLSEAVPTNNLLSRHPDLYFFGAMMFAEGFVANDQRAATFKVLWNEALAESRVYLTRQKFAGPLVPRVAFVP